MKEKFQNILIRLGFIKKIILPIELKDEFYERCKYALQHYNKKNNIKKYFYPHYIEIDWIMKSKCSENKCCYTIKTIRNQDVLAVILVIVLYIVSIVFMYKSKIMENSELSINPYVLISILFIPMIYLNIRNTKDIRDRLSLIFDQVIKNIINENDDSFNKIHDKE